MVAWLRLASWLALSRNALSCLVVLVSRVYKIVINSYLFFDFLSPLPPTKRKCNAFAHLLTSVATRLAFRVFISSLSLAFSCSNCLK